MIPEAEDQAEKSLCNTKCKNKTKKNETWWNIKAKYEVIKTHVLMRNWLDDGLKSSLSDL